MYIKVQGPKGPSIASSTMASGGGTIVSAQIGIIGLVELSVVRTELESVKVRLTLIDSMGGCTELPGHLAVQMASMPSAGDAEAAMRALVIEGQRVCG